MNILLLVFAFISAISLITYAQLTNLRDLGAMRKEYLCYMENEERAEFIKVQNKLYEADKKIRTSSKNAPDRIAASRKLNIHSILYEDKTSVRTETIHKLFHHLVDQLYGHQSFYIELKEKRPHVINELIQALHNAIKEQKETPVNKPNLLCNLILDDTQLQYFLALILGGTGDPCVDGDGVKNIASIISIKTTSRPIRIQLTSEALLLAIFQNPDIVKSIVGKRKELHALVTKNHAEKERASQLFFEECSRWVPKDLDPTFFNFDITTTD